MSDRMFVIRARNRADNKKAKVLEAIMNRPEIVSRIMDEVEKKLKESMDEIMWGYPCRPTPRSGREE